MTKDEHANKIISTVGTYFLAQRVPEVSQEADGYDACKHRFVVATCYFMERVAARD